MSRDHRGPTSAARARSRTRQPMRCVCDIVLLPLPIQRLSRSLAVVMLMGTAVASAPRTVSAQATTSGPQTVRHTLRGELGAVTQVELSSPWRPSGAEPAARSRDSEFAARGWMHRASVRSNVRTIVTLEPAANASNGDARNLWHVVDANGQLVPWRTEPVQLSHELGAGRHEVPIVWVAPPGATSAPDPVVRLRIVTGAR